MLLLFAEFVMALALTTARPLQDSTLGLDEVVFSPELSAIYVGSPSILRLRGTNAVLYATDRFGSGSFSRNVSVHRRFLDEKGFVNQSDWELVRILLTVRHCEVSCWVSVYNISTPLHFALILCKVTWVQDQYWSNLFQLESSSDVYLLGTAADGPAPIKISRSSDGGATWQGAVLFGEVSGNASYETGPTPVVETKGRVYRAMERLAPPFTWGLDYQAVSRILRGSCEDLSVWLALALELLSASYQQLR
jgi:hypothetical protein